jgi:hypothetical protein
MASTVTVDINDWYEAFMEMGAEVEMENIEAATSDVRELAKGAAEELRQATGPWSQTEDDPETGRPAYFFEKGWKPYNHAPTEGHVESVVANKNAPSLTHLVEKPHRLFVYGRDTGRMTQGHPIIREAYEHAAERFDELARIER